MSVSFHEKSLWLMFVSLFAAYGVYFARVLPTNVENVTPQQVTYFVLAIAVLVLVAIVGHVVIAISGRGTSTDERERLAELMGARNASVVLATGVFLALCSALLTNGNFVFTHVLLAFWGLAQLVNFGSQLFLLRRGV